MFCIVLGLASGFLVFSYALITWLTRQNVDSVTVSPHPLLPSSIFSDCWVFLLSRYIFSLYSFFLHLPQRHSSLAYHRFISVAAVADIMAAGVARRQPMPLIEALLKRHVWPLHGDAQNGADLWVSYFGFGFRFFKFRFRFRFRNVGFLIWILRLCFCGFTDRRLYHLKICAITLALKRGSIYGTVCD